MRRGGWGRVLAAGWVAGAVVLFAAWQPLWQPFAVLLGVAALFLVWWLRQKPSHDRDWDPSVAVLPRAVRDGDVVTIENVRNFEYRSLDDFTPRYETRTVHLANLRGLDIIFFNWGSPWMSHPVLVFDFGPDGRVCMSIEVRYRKGQKYSILRSLYRQQELIFLVADERDAILRRTKYGPSQEAHLYRLNASRRGAAGRVPRLRRRDQRPVRDAAVVPRPVRELHHDVLPAARTAGAAATGGCSPTAGWTGPSTRTAGWTGRCPSRNSGGLAYLNDIANGAPEDGFGDHIRRELERRRHER